MIKKLAALMIGFLSTFLLAAFTSTPVVPLDPSFACLENEGPSEVVSGLFNMEKFEPELAPYKKFDARGAHFEIPAVISHSMVSLDSDDDAHHVCWAGGSFTAALDWHNLDISWYESKHGYDNLNAEDPERGEMENTTAITAYEDQMTWTGLYVYNVHDGIRTSNTQDNWTIQHTWLEYIRDDCVENDHIWSGTIYDSLFDGCYTGFSADPGSGSEGEGRGKTIRMDQVLLRMEPMPYPYKWETKDDPVVGAYGYGRTPFGHGSIFKLTPGNEPAFEITNSVLLQEYNSEKNLFPPVDKITKCENNTLIWLADPSKAPFALQQALNNRFPGCLAILTDHQAGEQLWVSLVADWHLRHLGVGPGRKPALPGLHAWPRYPGELWMRIYGLSPNAFYTSNWLSSRPQPVSAPPSP